MRSSVLADLKLTGVQKNTQIRNLSCKQSSAALISTLFFCLFASARINERRYRLSLDPHRYAEVVEAQGDG